MKYAISDYYVNRYNIYRKLEYNRVMIKTDGSGMWMF